jgi:hypothetical protein
MSNGFVVSGSKSPTDTSHDLDVNYRRDGQKVELISVLRLAKILLGTERRG